LKKQKHANKALCPLTADVYEKTTLLTEDGIWQFLPGAIQIVAKKSIFVPKIKTVYYE
jgi:hypothetical protein